MKRLFITLALVLIASISFAASAAGAPATLVLSNVSLTQCAGTLIEGKLSVAAYDSNGELVNGTSGIQTTVYATHSNGAAAPQPIPRKPVATGRS